MLRIIVSLTLLFFSAGISRAAEPPLTRLDEKHREFFKTNCVACHNAEKQGGEVRLDDIAFTLDSVARADLWQKVLNAVNSGEMPPEDSRQPDKLAKTEFLEALSETLVIARKLLGDVHGKITMRRLNRREYKNTIRDLLGVDIGVKELPADGGAGTFDTVGSSLFMSSDQFEQYLALGRQAIDEHFARYAPTQPVRKLHVECEERNARIEKALAKRRDDRDRYVKWTAAVEAAAAKPENVEVVAKIRAEKKNDATHLYFQWQRLAGAPAPKEFGFVDAVNADEAGRRDWVHYVPHHRAYLEQPGIKTGSYLTIDDVFVNPYQPFRLPGDWPPGDYVVRVRIAATDAAPRERRFVEFGAQHDSGVRAVMGSYQITGTMAQPQVLEIPLKFSPNKGHGFFLQEKGSYESDGAANRLFAEARQRNGIGPEFALWLDWIEVASATATKTPTIAAKVEKLRKDPEQWANKYMPIYAQGYAEKYARFRKWCAAVDEVAKKPENADIVKKLREEPRIRQSPHLFYSRFAEIKDAPPPTKFGFKDVDDAQFARSEYTYHFRYYDDYQKLPARDTGSWLMLYSLGRYTGIAAPEKWPAGKYTLRVRLAAGDESPQERRFIEIGTGKADAADFNVLSAHQVTGTLANPQTLEIPVEINATGDRNFAIRDKRPNTRDAENAMWREAWEKTGTGPRPCIWIDYVELEGPLVPAVAVEPFKTHIEPETQANKEVAAMEASFEKSIERYRKWTAAVDKVAKLPEHAALVAELRKLPRVKAHPPAFYQFWAKRNSVPFPKDFGFPDGEEAEFQRGQYRKVNYVKDYLALPHKDTGAYLLVTQVHPLEKIEAPASWPVGDYVLRVRIGAVDGSPIERRFLQVGQIEPGIRSFSPLSAHQITGTVDQPMTLEIPVTLTTNGNRSFALREKTDTKGEITYAMWVAADTTTGGHGPKPALWIDWLELEGPVNASAPSATVLTKTIKQRREVELHANAMVGGTYNGYFKGGYEAAKKFLETGKPQKGIPDEQEAKFRVKVFNEHGPSFSRYLNDPLTKTGAYLTIFNVHPEEVITLPPDQPSGWLKTKHEVEKAEPGKYVLRFRIGAVKETPKERHFVTLGSRMKPEEKEDFTLLQTFQISGTTDEPQTIEVPVSIAADGPRTFVLREKRDVKLDHENYTAVRKETGVGPVSALWIDWVEWEGPLVKQPVPVAITHIETEKRRADVERDHLRYKYLNEQYAKWKAAGGDEATLKDFGFTDKSHADFSRYVWEQNNRWFQQYLDRPLSKSGLYLDNTVNETSEFAVDLPADIANGDYVMRVKIGRVPNMPGERAFLTFVEASPIDKDDRALLANKQITGMIDQPEIVELPFKVRPNGPRKFVLFEKRPLKKEAISLPGRTRQILDVKQRDPVLWIDWIEYEGPLSCPTGSRQIPPVVVADTTGASNRDHARAVIAAFAERAFRGKQPRAEYLNKLLALYDTRRKAGDAHEIALKQPLSVVLASPGFLYLQELGSASALQNVSPVHQKQRLNLSPIELASRLSYFLWSAPPDEQLLALARSGDLPKREILAREVDRLIADPRADEFVSGFVHQWLDMERLDFFQFDTKQFRDFDESAKAAARREVYETFTHLLRNNASLGRLLKSDEVVINGLLANYYGLDGVSGDEFRVVKLPADSPRGGLLGMAAILAMGSNGQVSSPVERGAWILRKLLHDPPPPAPKNVPQLTRLENQLLTTRERIIAHQEQPQCLQCHRKIDPIGFGLENFNAAGKWRTEETYEKRGVGKKTWIIDPSGAFYKGPAFKDYFELRDQIAAREAEFARGFTEALIEYALGRPYGFSDESMAESIVQQAATKQYSLRDFVTALVTSREFQQK